MNKVERPNLPLLPVGMQDFRSLRTNGRLYVDKTDLIHNLICEGGIFWFLPRPRRFGKSLLISTLKELFSGRKELFEGLYIEDKIEWEEYPVIHLDFSKMGFRDAGLYSAIDMRLDEIAKYYGFCLEKKGISLKFSELIKTLRKKTGKNVVILIDEYDKPITDVLEVGENNKAHEHLNILRTFYSIVKGSSENIRFFFLTGIARFARVSIFSDLNNLTDLSTNRDFHHLLGYTQEELLHYFPAHLNFIAAEKNISLDELLAQVKEWYNGFSWNGRDKLYNPFSILSFLTERNFKNFWFESGTPKFLVELLKAKEVYDLSGIEVDASETENIDIDNLGLITVFFQTGYLTVKEIDEYDMYTLDYPNKEVAESMHKHILAGFSENISNVGIAKSIIKAVKRNDFYALKNIFNTLFASVPYQIFDSKQEKFFHAILFLAFRLCGFYITSEVATSTGRIDAVMKVDNKIYIFEFKLNETADAAMQQIHERAYYKQFLGQGKEIHLVAVSFSGKTKSVEDMKNEELT